MTDIGVPAILQAHDVHVARHAEHHAHHKAQAEQAAADHAQRMAELATEDAAHDDPDIEGH